jgi:purine nucleoside phosphorylase
MLAIIGGSGLTRSPTSGRAARNHAHAVRRPSGAITFGTMRQLWPSWPATATHTIPPHQGEHRAKHPRSRSTTEDILGVASVGGIRPD